MCLSLLVNLCVPISSIFYFVVVYCMIFCDRYLSNFEQRTGLRRFQPDVTKKFLKLLSQYTLLWSQTLILLAYSPTLACVPVRLRVLDL